MAAPTSPFATTSQVAAFFPNITSNDFVDGETSPSKTDVESYLRWVDGQMLRRFQDAGYIIPLEEISGEDWLESQTQYLELLTILGVAGLISGPSILNVTNPGVTKNIFKQEYDAELLTIFNQRADKSTIRFRAAVIAGTPADRNIAVAQGMSSNFTMGYDDPTNLVGFAAMTEKVQDMQRHFEHLDLNWNYIYSLYNIGETV